MAGTRKKKMPFTPAGLNNMKPKLQRYEVAEPGGLRVSVGQRCITFIFRYKSPTSGKHRKLTLGNYPGISLKQARKMVATAKEMILEKVDPADIVLQDRRDAAESPTVEAMVTEFLEQLANRIKSHTAVRRYLEKELVPVLGPWKIRSVKRHQVVCMIDQITNRAPITARHTLVYTRQVFAHALDRGHLDFNVCADIKPPAKAKDRQRVLTESEIKKFWFGICDLNTSQEAKDILHLCLLTAQRSGEIRQIRWDDLDGDWWTIPPEISKNKLAHRVYLSPMAQEIISRRRITAGESPYIFPGRDPGKPLARNSPDQGLRRGKDEFPVSDFTVHDLRRSAASHMTAMGIPRLVVSMVLNHAQRGVTAVYDRHSYDPEKKAAMMKWEWKVAVILGLRKDDDLSPQEAVLADVQEQVGAATADLEYGDGPAAIPVTLAGDSWEMVMDILEGAAQQVRMA